MNRHGIRIEEVRNIELSRLQITGPISHQTPLVVLLEILDAHGISCDNSALSGEDLPFRLIREIKRVQVVSVSYEGPDFYPHLARFVNSSTGWRTSNLEKAFIFLHNFFNQEDILSKIPQDFEVGLQTPENPRKLNACILYAACLQLGVELRNRTTLEDMAMAIRFSRYPTRELYLSLNVQIKNLPQEKLIQLLLDVQGTLPHTTYGGQEQIGRNLRNLASAPVEVQSVDEAIACAAYYYNVDISRSLSPIFTYRLVAGRVPHEYPRLDRIFNQLLPASVYNVECLRELLTREGQATNIGHDSAHEQLQIIKLSETFYLGKSHNFVQQITTVYREDLEEVPEELLLGFGVYGEPLVPFTIEELEASFRSGLGFGNPNSTSGEIFPELAIKKLVAISQYPSPIEGVRELRVRLGDTIRAVERFLQSCSDQQRNLFRTYQQLSTERKRDVVDTFWSLHRLAMFMRGWNGESALPISVAPVDNQSEVDIRVTEGIVDFERRCGDLGEIGSMILQLPLMRYRPRSGIQTSSPNDPGPDIGSRLLLVKEGPDADLIDSCIRISSNWFAATSYSYLSLLSVGEIGYTLEDLREIS